MRKLLFALVVVSAMSILSGCATSYRVEYPLNNFDFQYKTAPCGSEPDSHNYAYNAVDGKKSITEDNVTVEVDSILSTASKEDFTVKAGVGEKEYSYSLFPMMAVLKVSNASDHIVTLERTIVTLEDADKRAYPMVNNIGENKRKLKSKIQKDLTDCINSNKEGEFAALKEYIFKDYAGKYNDVMDKINAKVRGVGSASHLIVEGVQQTKYRGSQYDGLEDYYYNPSSSEENYLWYVLHEGRFENIYSPDAVYKFMSGKLEKNLEGMTGKANEYIRSIMQKVDDMPDSFPNMITSGVYQPINILPGRTESIIVPFSKNKENEIIKKIYVHVFDLPTKVNEAGIPTKRASFHFEMAAEEVK